MIEFKCKACGAPLNIEKRQSIAKCEYCGISQTLPNLSNSKIENLYERANNLRRNSEFDKAFRIYEEILNEDATDAEAYWSLVLCTYGITYVEDPVTNKRVPTVNRIQSDPIMTDINYKFALQYANDEQKVLYEQEANTIKEIQYNYLSICQNEKPYDIFICYKESDDNGNRTIDSCIAEQLYDMLTNCGYKVFFARISLEDKLGTAYEPYIFAALNSAKIMLAIGTKREHYEAVWVKNEWSRYLNLVKTSRGTKTLIPVYKDMNPYELPDEFMHLQAQDMSKIGSDQDLIRGIKKILSLDENIYTSQPIEPTPIPAAPNSDTVKSDSAPQSVPTYSKTSKTGCLKPILILILIIFVISTFKSCVKSDKNSDEEAIEAVPASVETIPVDVRLLVGKENVNLKDLLSYSELKNVKLDETTNYSYDDVSCASELKFSPISSAFASAPAYSIVDLYGKCSKVSFKAIPHYENNNFNTDDVVKILAVNCDTGKIIDSTELNYDSDIVDFEFDVSGVDRFGIYMIQKDGVESSVYLKDVIFEPAAETDYCITGIPENAMSLSALTPMKEALITYSYDTYFICDDIIWDKSTVYRAGNGENTASAIYKINGEYKNISFITTPAHGNFTEGAEVELVIKNEETDEILMSKIIGREDGVIEIDVDITGVNKLGIYATRKSGMLTYLFIRNAYLYPSETE